MEKGRSLNLTQIRDAVPECPMVNSPTRLCPPSDSKTLKLYAFESIAAKPLYLPHLADKKTRKISIWSSDVYRSF